MVPNMTCEFFAFIAKQYISRPVHATVPRPLIISWFFLPPDAP